MPEEAAAISRTRAWLIARSGPMAGTRYLLRDGSTRIGRSPENEIALQGPNTATVSAQHVEIVCDDAGWHVRDAGSTNGTFLNGQRIVEAQLNGDAILQLGNDGPEFTFLREEVAAAADLDGTLVIPKGIVLVPPSPDPAAQPDGHEWLLRDAVSRARHARLEGRIDQTMSLMRDALQHALRRSNRRSRRTIWALTAALIIVTSAESGKSRGSRAIRPPSTSASMTLKPGSTGRTRPTRPSSSYRSSMLMKTRPKR
jgi:hypothetical protein